jgi:hypothetical protein
MRSVPKQNPFAETSLLRALAKQPDEQWSYAVTLLTASKNALSLMAAAKVLSAAGRPEGRTPIVERYAQLDADGTRRDQGALVRSAFVEALRPMGTQADLPLLQRAASTFEVLPTSTEDVAGGLRAAALVSLSQLDEDLARWHGARLLFDGRWAAMSGEPAVTAARVLAALGETLSLYGYASAPGGHGDVVGECLRHLAELPGPLLAELTATLLAERRELVLVGLFDLLLAHPSGAAQLDAVRRWLEKTDLLDAYRYLVTIAVAQRAAAWLDLVLAHAKLCRDPAKRPILAEALGLLAADPNVAAVVALLIPVPSTTRDVPPS